MQQLFFISLQPAEKSRSYNTNALYPTQKISTGTFLQWLDIFFLLQRKVHVRSAETQ